MSATTHGRDCATDPCEDCRLAVPPTDTYRHLRHTLRVGTEGDADE